MKIKDTSDYFYRLLEPQDADQYIELHRGRSKFMNTHLTETEKEEYLGRLSWLFNNEPNYKVSGCFLNDELVAVIGARYFCNYGVWYSHGQCFNLGDRTLNQALLFLKVQHELTIPLTSYAESNGMYQMYQSRELRQGLMELSYYEKRYLSNDKPLPFNFKYIPLIDKIYYPGDTDILEQHKFFFKPNNIVRIPTLIFTAVVKPEYRKKYILEKIANKELGRI